MTDVARLSRTLDVAPTPICVAAITRRALEEIAPFCRARQLRLRASVCDAAPAVGNADDLHQALMNVLLNAIRFTPDGGVIDVTLGRRSGVIDVTVADTGIGIPAAIHARIGDPFFTAGVVDRHHSDPVAFQSGGIGLGLAVARAIAAAHRGRLWFESEEGRGSTFHLELPAACLSHGGTRGDSE
jgi:signal transduction histidine kinase